MKAFIGLGKISVSHITLVLVPILTISGPLWIRQKKNNGKYNSVYIILNYISTFLLSVLIHLILINFNKSKRKDIDDPPLTNSITKVEKKKYYQPKTYLMLFLLAFLDFARLTGLIFLGVDDTFLIAQIELRTTELIFMSILSKFLLNTILFKHHLVSIISIFIGICLSASFAIQNIDSKFWYEVPLAIFFYFCLSLKCICDKWMMDIKFITFQRLLIYEGLFGTIISISILGFQHYIKCPTSWKYCGDNHYFSNIFTDFVVLFTNEKDLIFPVIVYVFIHSANNVIMMLIIKYLSPCHRAVSDTIAYFIWISVIAFQYNNNLQFSLLVIGYCVIFIASLVYNEVLILYFCNLEYNVKIEIMERGDKSFLFIEKNNPLIDDVDVE